MKLSVLYPSIRIGNITTIIPLIQAELSPPKSRGLLVGFHGAFILVGYTSAAWIGAGFYHVPNVVAQWRVPLCFQLIAPVILVATIFCIPESPRWREYTPMIYLVLCGPVLNDRSSTKSFSVDERRKRKKYVKNYTRMEAIPKSKLGDTSLLKVSLCSIWHHIHSSWTTFSVQGQWEIDKAQPSSWLAIVTVPSYRKRAIIGFLCLFFGQTTGTLVRTLSNPFLVSDEAT
jgi:MFS family permease